MNAGKFPHMRRGGTKIDPTIEETYEQGGRFKENANRYDTCAWDEKELHDISEVYNEERGLENWTWGIFSGNLDMWTRALFHRLLFFFILRNIFIYISICRPFALVLCHFHKINWLICDFTACKLFVCHLQRIVFCSIGIRIFCYLCQWILH